MKSGSESFLPVPLHKKISFKNKHNLLEYYYTKQNNSVKVLVEFQQQKNWSLIGLML